MADKCPFCGAELEDRRPNSKGQIDVYECWTWAQWHSKGKRFVIGSKCKDRQISDLQASRDRWREYAMSLKRQQYQELITEDMIAEEYKAISALKAAGEWEL